MKNVNRNAEYGFQRSIAAIFFFLFSFSCVAQENSSIYLKYLLSLNAEWEKPHEGAPMGVPRDYSWAVNPRIGAGNQPGKYSAVTGWGHVFWSIGTLGHPGQLQIKNFHTFICRGPDKVWDLAQRGRIEGAEFRADFKNNASTPANYWFEENTAMVLFDAGRTFHFWPAASRARLRTSELCGFVVLLQAKASNKESSNPLVSGGYLIGIGADYWVDTTSSWNNFKTNTDVGIGRLRFVGSDWAWYGMSTASNEDLQRLYASGLLNNIQ